MWKKYLVIVVGLTIFIIPLHILLSLQFDTLPRGSWQIVVDNILLVPGFVIIGPLLGAPEGMIANICTCAVIIISAAVYAFPLTVALKLWKSFKVNKR